MVKTLSIEILKIDSTEHFFTDSIKISVKTTTEHSSMGNFNLENNKFLVTYAHTLLFFFKFYL